MTSKGLCSGVTAYELGSPLARTVRAERAPCHCGKCHGLGVTPRLLPGPRVHPCCHRPGQTLNAAHLACSTGFLPALPAPALLPPQAHLAASSSLPNRNRKKPPSTLIPHGTQDNASTPRWTEGF